MMIIFLILFLSVIIVLTPHFFVCLLWSVFGLPGFASPRNDFAVAQEFTGQILRGVERKPDGGVCALRNIALGVCAAHVGFDPARTHGVDRNRAAQFGGENPCDGV